MGYPGEDVPAARGDWGRQTPWRSPADAPPENAGDWESASRGYADGGNYPQPDGGFGYGPDGGYPGQGQPGYPDQYGNAYQPHHDQYGAQYGGQGPGQGQPGTGGYGTQGYPQPGDYGYEHGQAAPSGYDQGGYDQPGYEQPGPGYGPGGGYDDPSGGYGQPPGYPAQAQIGGYQGPRGGSGAYPALPPGGHGGYQTEDAGNDWYGGQPAAANGASFADTGSYRLNGRVIDEYGTGPREAVHDPARGYPPDAGQQGTGPLPGPMNTAPRINPVASGPQPFQRGGSPSVAETRQQERLDERAGYQEYGGEGPGAAGFGPRDAFSAPGYGGYPGSRPADEPAGGYNGYDEEFATPEADGDPYQDRYGAGAGTVPAPAPGARGGRGGARRDRAAARGALGPLRGKRLLFAALGVVAVGIIGVAAYAFIFKSNSPANNPSAQGPLPTGSAQPSQQACAKTLGTYCHIEASTDDPKPLTVAELYPPAFTNEQDKSSYSLVSTKLDTKCSNAVIGSALSKAIQSGKCTQVVRASYVSGNNKIMGTIGVVNLSTTNQAHYAGRVVGQNDFIAPLTSKKGVASKLGNGTGVVEAQFKGHYLILTWSEFVDGTDPKTKAQDAQLEQFSNDLVGETANIALSQRMVTGAPATPAPAA